jgi:large subunit ribosomal protein L22
MQFTAVARGINYSPYKLRPLIDVIRGKGADYAVAWCRANKNRRMMPIIKVLDSAIANALYKNEALTPGRLVVKQIFVDQGKALCYFKPGAQGRAMIRHRRSCHISIVLEAQLNEVFGGSKG